MVCVGVDGLYDDVGVEEMRGNHVGHKWSVLLLKDDGNDVVSDVTLSLQL